MVESRHRSWLVTKRHSFWYSRHLCKANQIVSSSTNHRWLATQISHLKSNSSLSYLRRDSIMLIKGEMTRVVITNLLFNIGLKFTKLNQHIKSITKVRKTSSRMGHPMMMMKTIWILLQSKIGREKNRRFQMLSLAVEMSPNLRRLKSLKRQMTTSLLMK